VLVVGGGTGLGAQLALGLADHGARVAVVAPAVDATVQAELAAGGHPAPITAAIDGERTARAAFERAGAGLGQIDAVVDALIDPAALEAAPVSEVSEADWDRRCEAELRTALVCAQAAFSVLRFRGGRLVLLTPTIGITGAAGLVPYASVVEGRRALAKSAARQWGGHGITVNCVAPPVSLVREGALDPAVEAPALGRAPTGREDVAPVVAMLLADPAHFVTGATVAVDGGVVMAP
jgi:NAD(P)-dependent dehydrogenase (short-subunit alcohol dehydrogenase family)